MDEQRHTIEELKQWQALPLQVKVGMSMTRIRQWVHEYFEDGVYVSFSGGKDSTVLSHLVDRAIPGNNIPRVFVNTGLEYPEVVQFVRKEPRAVIVRPKMNFKKVIEQYGYPFFSKETSEVIYNAKKYLTKLANAETIDYRQTDRQLQLPYKYSYDRLLGQGEYAKSKSGGADAKYRKLRGLGEFSKAKGQMDNAVESGMLPRHIRTALAREEDGSYP